MFPYVNEFIFDDSERDTSLIQNDWWCLRSVSHLIVDTWSNISNAAVPDDRLLSLVLARLPHVRTFSLTSRVFFLLATNSSTATVLNRQIRSLHLIYDGYPLGPLNSDRTLMLLVSGLLPDLCHLSFKLFISLEPVAAHVTIIVHKLVNALPKLTYLLIGLGRAMTGRHLARDLQRLLYVDWPPLLRRYHRVRCLERELAIWF
jgi:hypothetical protein